MYEAGMIQRIALYATLGYLLDALGQGANTLGFWCVLGLFFASETLTRVETLHQVQEHIDMMRKKQQQQGADNDNINSDSGSK